MKSEGTHKIVINWFHCFYELCNLHKSCFCVLRLFLASVHLIKGNMPMVLSWMRIVALIFHCFVKLIISTDL